MATYVLTVYTQPVKGVEDEYHRWYDMVHLAEVLTVPGFVRAQRFAVTAPAFAGVPDQDRRFAAVYTVESDDIDATMKVFDDMRTNFSSTPAIDLSTLSFELLRPIGA